MNDTFDFATWLGALALVSALAGCSTWGTMGRQEKGTAVGATGGALVGAAVAGPVGAAVDGVWGSARRSIPIACGPPRPTQERPAT